jgi:hypothetical protein
MISILIPSFLTFPITIDRVEGDHTVIEWKNGTLDTVPTYLFPKDVYEGQSWYLHLQKKGFRIPYHSSTGLIVNEYPAYLYQYSAIISLPHPIVLPLGEIYKIKFSPMRGTYVQ